MENKELRILGFGTMNYQTIINSISRRLETTLEDTTPSEKRILGQMLLTIADHEQSELIEQWGKEEEEEIHIVKKMQEFDVRSKLYHPTQKEGE